MGKRFLISVLLSCNLIFFFCILKIISKFFIIVYLLVIFSNFHILLADHFVILPLEMPLHGLYSFSCFFSLMSFCCKIAAISPYNKFCIIYWCFLEHSCINSRAPEPTSFPYFFRRICQYQPLHLWVSFGFTVSFEEKHQLTKWSFFSSFVRLRVPSSLQFKMFHIILCEN